MVVPRLRSAELLGGWTRLGPLDLVGNATVEVAARLRDGWPPTDGSTIPAKITIGTVASRPIALGVDESYRLTIDDSGITLDASTDVGARRGIETLLQLVWNQDDSAGLEHVRIGDAPRFAWRGLLIDPCRHWVGVETVLETLDAMAAAKLNVLHLHLSDDQAFRLESRRWPDLHRRGSDGRYFTHDDIGRIVDHAAAAGIRVVPEIDMPGHITSWLVGYPSLAATPGPFVLRSTLGIADVALDPISAEGAEFVEGLLNEVVSRFPDRSLHVGGDEVSSEAWPNLEVAVVQRTFTAWVTELVRSLDRTAVVWDEAWHPDLPSDVVIQVWRGHRRLRAAAAVHRPVLFSTPYYLDLGYDPIHHQVDPLGDESDWDRSRQRLHDDPRMCSWGPIAAAMHAEFEGTDPAPSTVDRTTVLGGEACMWSELVPERNLALRLWPTAAAVADVLWSDELWSEDDGEDPITPLSTRLDWFARSLAATTATDVETTRRERWLALGRGDPLLASAIATLASCCEPSKWYSRHAALPDGELDQPFDRFVDALAPSAPNPTADDPTEWRAAAERILTAIDSSDVTPQLAELAPLAQQLLSVCDGSPVNLASARGEVLVTARLTTP